MFSQTHNINGVAVELFFGTENVNPVTKPITIHMTAVGAVWGADKITPTDLNFYITNEFSDSFFIPYSNNDTLLYHWGGYDFITSIDNQGRYPAFGYGIYKIYSDDSPAYFYIDYRDDRYGRYENFSPPSFGHDADIWLKYNDLWDYFSLTTSSSIEFGTPLFNGELLTIWNIKQKGLPLTNEFPNFWKNCLVLIESEKNNPRLVWGKYPSFETTNYKIYRAISSTPNPRNLSYSLIHTTSSANEFEYIDEDLSLGNFDYVFYYVVAYNAATNTSSEASNVITTRAGMYKQAIENNENQETASKFKLEENYPNPFNPSTTISFVIPNEVRNLNDTRSTEYYSVLQNVTLKVYDVLGREVATLVNEQKPAGNYEVNFDASGLSSGIYYYSLRAGSFIETRKMILLR